LGVGEGDLRQQRGRDGDAGDREAPGSDQE
jgi:hypothetical protein